MDANLGSEALIMVPTSDHGVTPDPGALFDRHKERLRRMVRLRLDRRLSGLVDSSGVLKLARDEVARRGGELAKSEHPNAFLWLRQVTGQVLAQFHKERLGGDVRGDISLYRGALPEATSVSLAAHFLGRGGGDDQRAAARAEQKLMLQETLNAMEPLDREVLTLRHCEQLTNDETARVLGVPAGQASEAYIRALKRITVSLAALPGFKGKS
jgi:RNA polymerase sigma-70 factor, ECF subfamily